MLYKIGIASPRGKGLDHKSLALREESVA